jgi:hypothetical protein
MRPNAMTRPRTSPAINEPNIASVATLPVSGISTHDRAPAIPVSASSMTVRTTTSSRDMARPAVAGGAGGYP